MIARMADPPQRWHLVRDDHTHVVEVASGTLTAEARWSRDEAREVIRRTSDETIVLTAPEDSGAVRVRLSRLGTTRRVTLHSSEARAHAGLGGIDFAPEAGSKAALRAEWIDRHPHLHTARQTAVATVGVLVPVLLVWLLTRVPWPHVDVPWPDLPSLPWPSIDLPAIPWPDINVPSLPNLPQLPEQLDPVRRFVVPVLIAFFLARGEVKRRRRAAAEASGRETTEE